MHEQPKLTTLLLFEYELRCQIISLQLQQAC